MTDSQRNAIVDMAVDYVETIRVWELAEQHLRSDTATGDCALARQLGVAPSLIWAVRSGKIWKHVVV